MIKARKENSLNNTKNYLEGDNMTNIARAQRMANIHSDIRGPLYVEALKMQQEGKNILKLNTGNPATFGFGLPDSIKNALTDHIQDGVGYCDFKGMPAAREAI